MQGISCGQFSCVFVSKICNELCLLSVFFVAVTNCGVFCFALYARNPSYADYFVSFSHANHTRAMIAPALNAKHKPPMTEKEEKQAAKDKKEISMYISQLLRHRMDFFNKFLK